MYVYFFGHRIYLCFVQHSTNNRPEIPVNIRLISEESSHLTPKTPKCSTPPSSNTENSSSTETPRDHPNSANQVRSKGTNSICYSVCIDVV